MPFTLRELREDGNQVNLHSLGFVSKFCFYGQILLFLDEGIRCYFQLWVVTVSWYLALGVFNLYVLSVLGFPGRYVSLWDRILYCLSCKTK